MAKVVNGWRTTYKWENPSACREVAMLTEAYLSHDGWVCPHCEHKSDVYEEEMNNEKYIDLMCNSKEEPLRIECSNCYKEFFLRADVTIKYETCVDKDFGDGNE